MILDVKNSMKKEQQIYCEIKSPNKRVKLEFDVSPDWIPQTSACWAECPFSVCTFLGETCRALKNNICPFSRGLNNSFHNITKE